MTMKELGHRLQIENKVRPISVANAAAFNAAFTTTNVDTIGCEGVMFILQFGDDNATPDYVFELFDTDVSATDAGTICAAGSVAVHGHTAAGAYSDAEAPAATGVLTTTNNASEDLCYTLEYIGNKRWVRVQCPTGTKTNHVSCVVVKSDLRRIV